ncbi:MAG TPA: hypothetical protein VGC99_00230 [Candidatus Tectomicrobia bacterium]
MNPSNQPAKGCQDVSGWGLAGLTAGIVAGFVIAYYWLIPLFPRAKTTGVLTLMTTIVVAAMTLGGVVGYLATRRKTRLRPRSG